MHITSPRNVIKSCQDSLIINMLFFFLNFYIIGLIVLWKTHGRTHWLLTIVMIEISKWNTAIDIKIQEDKFMLLGSYCFNPPFPRTTNLQQTTLKMSEKYGQSKLKSSDIKLIWKHFDKRINCPLWATFPFTTIFCIWKRV